MVEASMLLDGAGVDGNTEPFVATQLARAAPVFGFWKAEYFPDQEMRYSIFRKRYGLTISCAQDYVQSV
jgi:hypothetical protein